MGIYLELRVFRYDASEHGPYEPTRGEAVDGTVVEFANLANAAATYESMGKVLTRAIERGVPAETERVKPGGVPYSKNPKDGFAAVEK